MTADREVGHHPSSLSLQQLPSEIVQLIVAYLPTATLKDVALVSHTLGDHATAILWQSVCLVDQWKLHMDEHRMQSWGDRGRGKSDEHDDTPIIHRLHILATNPTLASKVQVLTHRCHLPTPNIFTELPLMHFDADHLSHDGRLHTLLKLAIPNLVNVHTLHIVYGHWYLTNALVSGFFHHLRPRRVPLRKLWLESCCLSVDPAQFLANEQGTALESIRIRRLFSESLDTVRARGLRYTDFKLCRGGRHYPLRNGSGGWIGTTVQLSDEGRSGFWSPHDAQEVKNRSEAWDNAIWEGLSDVMDFIHANRAQIEGSAVPPTMPREPVHWLITSSASTLTSLNLDWILWRRRVEDNFDHCIWVLETLRSLRFPLLRAFQLRNATTPHTELPSQVFLLENFMLEFLEAHPKIQCLGWPMDRFYSHVKPTANVRNRTRKLVAHLAMMLTDLRIDTQYGEQGEPLTDESTSTEDVQSRIRRRRFIAEFVPHLRRVENIKIEGGIPRDEKREILRALHWCPLKKVVMIGVSFPAGNTWGHQGLQWKALDPGHGSEIDALEGEDLAGILASYKRGVSLPLDFNFEPVYGWPAQGPLIQTMALHHASTIEELKISGNTGCPILSFQTPITGPLLNDLRHYDNLKQLIISLWLVTWYEDSHRDVEIIQSWLDTRSPSSTALTIVTPPASPSRDHPVDPAQFPNFNNPHVAPRTQEFNRWAVALKTQFSPSALAYRVARDIGPYLSPVAKERPGGVKVRASFCLGAKLDGRSAKNTFDLDLRIGSADQVLEFVGPREEEEKGRWWDKLEARRWF